MSNGQETETEQSNLPAAEGADAPDVSGGEAHYGALKCYFYTPKRGDIWGAFCFLFNGATGEAMDSVFWVTRSLAGPSIDINEGWRVLNKSIPRMGVYEKSIGDKLSASMLEIFSTSERTSLLKDADPAEHIAALAAEIRNSFERMTHYFLEFKLELEVLSESDLAKAGVLTDGSSEEVSAPASESSIEKSFSGTLITCLPIIDPVWGVPVSELKPGDKVEVKLHGGVGAGELIQKYLSSHDQDAIFAIENIERGDDEKTYVFLDISEEISGMITLTKDLRIKTISTSSQLGKTIKINTDNMIFFGVIAVAVVAMFFIIRHFFF